jgi:hypothetical protein
VSRVRYLFSQADWKMFREGGANTGWFRVSYHVVCVDSLTIGLVSTQNASLKWLVRVCEE